MARNAADSSLLGSHFFLLEDTETHFPHLGLTTLRFIDTISMIDTPWNE